MKKRLCVAISAVLCVTALGVFALDEGINKLPWTRTVDEGDKLARPEITYNTVTVDGKSMDYIVSMPRLKNFTGAGKDSTIKYPVILNLHGSGGDVPLKDYKNQLPERAPLMEHLSDDYEFPFIVISPIMPDYNAGRNSWISHKALVMKALDTVNEAYSTDIDRIYLTGFSMGGYGTYDYALEYPNRWAAIVPVAGNMSAKKAFRLVNIPTWAFHGSSDQIVSYNIDRDVIDEMVSWGANASLTSLGVGHTITPEMYCSTTFEWMLKNTLRKDTEAPKAPRVNKVYTTSTKIKGSISGEIGSKVRVKVGDKLIGKGYVKGNGGFSINIPKQKKGKKLEVFIIDQFANLGTVKTVKVLKKK